MLATKLIESNTESVLDISSAKLLHYKRLAEYYGIDQNIDDRSIRRGSLRRLNPFNYAYKNFNEVGCININIQRGSLRRLNPVNFVYKKLERSKSQIISQPWPFSVQDVELGFVSVDMLEQSQSSDQPQNFCKINLDCYSITSSCSDNANVEELQGRDNYPTQQRIQNINKGGPCSMTTKQQQQQEQQQYNNNKLDDYGKSNHMSISTQTSSQEDETQVCSSVGSRQIGKSGDWNSWIIRVDDLKSIRKLGGGGYGEVFLGIWGGKPVAYKIMYPPKHADTCGPDYVENFQKAAEEKFKKDFKREVEILMQQGHPNIVQFYGADPDNNCIVTEYIEYGSVYDLLHGRVHNFLDINEEGLRIQFLNNIKFLRNLIKQNFGVQLDIALQVAHGLKYLHDKGIWHLDLKTQNMLVGEQYNRILIKVCDFGLSRIQILRAPNSQGCVGTCEYMAPEVLTDSSKISDKADIYSFGYILYELVTLQQPWRDYWPCQVWYQVVKNKKRLKIPETVKKEIKNLILKCWAENPSERPSINEIIEELEELLDDYPSRNVFDFKGHQNQIPETSTK